MKIEDVVHFYLGQKAMFDNKIGKIGFVAIENGMPMVKLYFEKYRVVEAWASEIKLCLRPLSSMTEEDLKEYLLLDGRMPLSNEIEIKSITKNLWISYWWKGSCGGGSFNLKHGSLDQFKFLLSKSYDLYDLISSQQAIDITKLNKNEG